MDPVILESFWQYTETSPESGCPASNQYALINIIYCGS